GDASRNPSLRQGWFGARHHSGRHRRRAAEHGVCRRREEDLVRGWPRSDVEDRDPDERAGSPSEMIPRRLAAWALLFIVAAAQVKAEQHLTLVSVGALEPGARAAVARFESETGIGVDMSFGTTAVVTERLSSGQPWDVVLAPDATLNDVGNAQ